MRALECGILGWFSPKRRVKWKERLYRVYRGADEWEPVAP